VKNSVASSKLSARCCVRLLERTTSDDLPSRQGHDSSHIEWNGKNTSRRRGSESVPEGQRCVVGVEVAGRRRSHEGAFAVLALARLTPAEASEINTGKHKTSR
jgi:hypothetical protein